MQASPRSTASVVIALVVGVLAIAHVRELAGGQTWEDLAYHTTVAPPRLAASDALAAGTLPRWWDGTSLGVPLLGDASHGALAPAIWLARSPRALDWIMLAHLAWLAIGIVLWARRTASDGGAVVAAIAIGASGLFVSTALRGALPAIAHLPWLALAASQLATARRPAAWAIAVAAALAMIGLAGQLAVLVDGIALAIVLGARRATWRWLAIAIVAGLAIASAQWIPVLAAIGTTAGGSVGAMPLARIVELVAPAPSTGHGWPSVFVGAPLFALAAIAASSRRRTVLLVALGALALVGGRGGWPMILGAPELHLAAFAIVVAPQAAAGLDALYAGERRARLALVVGAACSLVALVALLASHAGGTATLVDGGLGILCIAGALTIAWRDGEIRAGARAVIAALLVAPSLGALGIVVPLVDRAIVADPSHWAELAQEAHAPRRVFRPAFVVRPSRDPAEGVLPFDDQIATLAGDIGARFGLASARSEDPARPVALDLAFAAAAYEGGALLDRYGIELWIVPTAIVMPRKLPALAQRSSWSLVDAPVAPVASVVRGAMFARDPRDALALLFPPGGGTGVPRGTTVIAGTGDTRVDTHEPVPCAIDRWDPGDLALRCTGPGYAVVSSTALPGWDVAVDGAPGSPLVADAVRRAVAIPAGPHAIVWSYRAPGFAIGLALAAGGIAILLALVLVSLRRTARPASPETTASTSPRSP